MRHVAGSLVMYRVFTTQAFTLAATNVSAEPLLIFELSERTLASRLAVFGKRIHRRGFIVAPLGRQRTVAVLPARREFGLWSAKRCNVRPTEGSLETSRPPRRHSIADQER